MTNQFLSRRAMLTALTGVALAQPAAGQTPARAAPLVSARQSQAIEISARPIETFSRASNERRFGRLEFRGGLVLKSTEKIFGGLSGLAMEPDGRNFVAISDEGHWLTATLTSDGKAPSGITNARMGPILASNGRELGKKRDQDAEAIALVEGNLGQGQLLIAFERNHRIGRFPITNRMVQAPVGYLKMPAETRQMKSNKGLEAMTVMAGGPHKGSVVAFSERLLDAAGHHSGWIWINGEPRRFALKDVDEFDLTDAAALPDGSLLVLERRFRWSEGVKLQLRLLKPSEINPGVVAEGVVLLNANMGSEIDNMEGLSVHKDSAGTTILTMVSDDNYNSFLQRTILLQFALL